MQDRPSLLGGLLALVLGSVLLVFIGEGVVRLFGYAPLFDTYSKPSVFWIHDPVLGWVHEPNAEGEYVGPRPWPVQFRSPVRINSTGQRGPEIEELPEDGLRILALGDSQTASFEVAHEKSYVALLQEELTRRLGRPVQVINAGVRGYGTDQSYLYYRERGRLLKPDLVMFMHKGNDLRNNVTLHRTRRPFGKAAFALLEDGTLELRGTPVPRYPICQAYKMSSSLEVEMITGPLRRAICAVQMKLFDHSALFTLATMVLRETPNLLIALYRSGDLANQQGESAMTDDYPHRLTNRLIRELADAVREDGADFLLLGQDQPLERLGREALESEFAVLSISPVEGDDPQAVVYQHDSHYNELGHERMNALLAPALAEKLRERVSRDAEPAQGPS